MLTPLWAYAENQEAVFVADTWRGTLYNFFTWMCLNNGANRKLSAWFTQVESYNMWNKWARENSGLVDATWQQPTR